MDQQPTELQMRLFLMSKRAVFVWSPRTAWLWLGISLFVFVVLWRAFHPVVCHSSLVNHAVLQGEWAGCFEFWLNRYQTIAGAVVAIAAATLAWRGLRAQLDLALAVKLKPLVYDLRSIKTLNRRACDELLMLLQPAGFVSILELKKTHEERLDYINAFLRTIDVVKQRRNELGDIYRRIVIDDDLYQQIEILRNTMRLAFTEAKAVYRHARKQAEEGASSQIYVGRISEVFRYRQDSMLAHFEALAEARQTTLHAIDMHLWQLNRTIKKAHKTLDGL